MDQDKKQTWDFITKKDLVYIIIFLIFIIVVIFTLKFEDPQFLTAQLSLGATIFSIFLAVIAILISFMQSNESSRQSNQMTKEIHNQSKEIAKMSARYASLMTEQQDVNEETSEKIVQKVQENKEVPDDLKNEILKIVEEAKNKQDAILQEKSQIEDELAESYFSDIEKNKISSIHLIKVKNFISRNYEIGESVTLKQLEEDLINIDKIGYPSRYLRSILNKLQHEKFIKLTFINGPSYSQIRFIRIE